MWYIVVQHPPSLKKTRNQKQAKEKRTGPIKTVSTWRSLWNEFYKNSFLHDVVLNLIEGSLGSRCDRRGPHSIVAGNVSSYSIPGVLGIVSPVKSTFGGWLVECVDAISSWSISVLYPSAGSAFALLIGQWLRRTDPITVLTTQDLGVGFSSTSQWIHGWDLLAGEGGFEVHFFPFCELSISKRG